MHFEILACLFLWARFLRETAVTTKGSYGEKPPPITSLTPTCKRIFLALCYDTKLELALFLASTERVKERGKQRGRGKRESKLSWRLSESISHHVAGGAEMGVCRHTMEEKRMDASKWKGCVSRFCLSVFCRGTVEKRYAVQIPQDHLKTCQAACKQTRLSTTLLCYLDFLDQ